MNGSRALLRIAWRESWRHKRRSALVIGLVAFPVAVASGGVTFATMMDKPKAPVVVPWAWILAAVGGVALVLTAAGWLTAGRRPVRPVNVIRL